MSTETSLGHILVVDDDRGVLAIVEVILGKDYTITKASSAKEAMEILESKSIDLVLLDIMMPEMDGLQACARIKGNPRTASIPIIFLTGMDDEDAEESALDAGAVDFISKPIRPRILQSRVRLQMENALYLQFLERMLREKSTTVDKLRAETEELLKSIGLATKK